MALKKLLKKPAEQEALPVKPGDRPHEEGDDESNWLVSYADMMTLLCGFFIMLFSMATLETPKYDSFKEAISQQFGGNFQSPTKDLALFITQVIQEAGVEKDVVVKSDPSGVS